ncbi:hypothetical protein PRVXT_001512 [Proteinivorax tanatarense]|uniref:Uncharacterized protein n=1 Tax=Proteinivorax tanatarense TaxID=1260629 RepID=A0AAU7VQH2_9FIRM
MIEALDGLMLNFEGVVEEVLIHRGLYFSHSELFRVILMNNLRVSAFMVLLGFIPLIVLPAGSSVISTMSVSNFCYCIEITLALLQ